MRVLALRMMVWHGQLAAVPPPAHALIRATTERTASECQAVPCARHALRSPGRGRPGGCGKDDIWAGYSKVVQDLLRDREYPRPVSLSSVTSGQRDSGNKFVGEPQSVSTRPLIVSPNMDSSDLGDQPRDQPRDDLLTSYSDRYGWGQSQAYRDSLREFNR